MILQGVGGWKGKEDTRVSLVRVCRVESVSTLAADADRNFSSRKNRHLLSSVASSVVVATGFSQAVLHIGQ